MSTASSSAVLPISPPTVAVDRPTFVAIAAPIVAAEAATPTGAPRARAKRDPDLDACRVIASLGVVWCHAAQVLPNGVGRFAVPMFTIMSLVFCALALRKRPTESSPAFIAKRFARIYPAFIFWCLAYLVLGQAGLVLTGRWSQLDFHWTELLGGTQEHLWFLPFLLIATCLAVPPLRFAAHHAGARSAIGWTGAAFGIAWAATPIPAFVHDVSPISPWYWLVHGWWAMPSAFVAIALGCWAISRNDGIRVPAAFGVVGAALLAFGSYLNWSVVDEPFLIGTTCAGVGMFWIAGSGLLPRGLVTRLAPIGAYGMGIYLSHPLVLKAFKTIAEHRGFAPSPTMDVARFVVGAAGALMIAWLLGRSRWTRWTIGA